MTSIFYQLMNLLLIVFLLGIPVVITLLLLKHFNGKRNQEDTVSEKLKELEERIRQLEDRL